MAASSAIASTSGLYAGPRQDWLATRRGCRSFGQRIRLALIQRGLAFTLRSDMLCIAKLR